ncbi:MAG TPA: hypothetical protein VGG32_07500 [Thermoplasmata archaeon]
MSMPGSSASSSRILILVVGIAVGIVVGLLLGAVLQPASSSSGSSPVASAAVSVHSHAWALTTGPTTTTPLVNVLAGSAAYLFVGYVNPEIGGGVVSSITDTVGDTYSLVISTGYVQNHTQDLYVAEPIQQTTSLSVTVTFSGGATPMGGSVALVDVTGSGLPAVDAVYMQSGAWTGTASVAVVTTHSNDLLLLGVSGMGRDAPFAPATGETLLDTSGNTSGPWEDGTGFGTFATTESGTGAFLSATLATPAEWTAIGVGIFVAPHPSLASAGSIMAPTLWAGTPSVVLAVMRPL